MSSFQDNDEDREKKRIFLGSDKLNIGAKRGTGTDPEGIYKAAKAKGAG